jgi:selenide,water dikinase
VPIRVHKEILKGFSDFCEEVDAPVVGGHTIISPWPIIGGAVTALAETGKTILMSKAQPGDRVILTKPLGIKPIMKVLRLPDSQQEKLAALIPDSELSDAIDSAVRIMTKSERGAALAMLDVGVNASTDVTGFGILGHATNMAEQSGVSIRIHTLPVIPGAPKIAEFLGAPLLEGNSAETAGGFLASLTEGKVRPFLEALKKRGCGGYEVGVVEEGKASAILSDDLRVMEHPGFTRS